MQIHYKSEVNTLVTSTELNSTEELNKPEHKHWELNNLTANKNEG